MYEEIRLRKLKKEDAPWMLEWMTDPSIYRFFRFDAKHITLESCERFISDSSSDHSVHFAIVSEDDQYLGTISLKNIDLQKKEAEYAISTRKIVHGKGVAAKATKLILKYAFEQLQLDRVYLNVLQENARANAFYKKMGFCFDCFEMIKLDTTKEPVRLNWYSINNANRR